METVYEVSPEALIYSAVKLGKPEIFGVPYVDIPENKSSEFEAFAARAQLELLEKKYGSMDFSSNFTLNNSFKEVVKDCCDSSHVLDVNVNSEGKSLETSIFIDLDTELKIRRENFICTCEISKCDSLQSLKDILSLPSENEEELPSLKVDTEILEKGDTEALKEMGCKKEIAEMIVSAFNGTGHLAHIKEIFLGVTASEFMLIYGKAGILSATEAFDEKHEYLNLTPIKAEDIFAVYKEIIGDRDESEELSQWQHYNQA